MFIPIIIPMFNRFDDDDDCDRKHGRGCQCSECLEKKKWDEMPREYYKERYAIPKSFVIKNTIFKVLRLVSLVIGIILVISPITFLDISSKNHFLFIVLPLVFGFSIAIGGFIGFDSNIKQPYECKDKIHLKADYFTTDKDWDEICKKNNVPKNYVLTEVETNWKYK